MTLQQTNEWFSILIEFILFYEIHQEILAPFDIDNWSFCPHPIHWEARASPASMEAYQN